MAAGVPPSSSSSTAITVCVYCRVPPHDQECKGLLLSLAQFFPQAIRPRVVCDRRTSAEGNCKNFAPSTSHCNSLRSAAATRIFCMCEKGGAFCYSFRLQFTHAPLPLSTKSRWQNLPPPDLHVPPAYYNIQAVSHSLALSHAALSYFGE